MKQFKRVEPTTIHKVGGQYKRETVVKTFQDEDGYIHEFTTWGREDKCSCAVIALTADNRVVMMHEFRAGPEAWMHELPGGGVEKGEDPKVGALRELAEETGYEVGDITLLGNVCRDAYMNGRWYYYFATGCRPSKAGRKLDPEEERQGAEVALISIDELIKNAKAGNMTDPLAVLMAYDKLKEIQNGA